MSAEVGSDLEDIDTALASDREDLALAVLQAHITRLEAFAEEVRRTVASSVVEREAEAVLDAVIAAVPAPPEAPDPVGHADQHDRLGARSRDDQHDRLGARSVVGAAVRRGLVAVACLAAAAAIVMPGSSVPPGDPLEAALTASEQALVAAVDAAQGSPTGLAEVEARNSDLRLAIAGLDRRVLADPAVRRRLETMLADQQQALVSLAHHRPAAAGLLVELRRLAAALDLHLPDAPLPQPGPTLPLGTPSLPPLLTDGAEGSLPSVDLDLDQAGVVPSPDAPAAVRAAGGTPAGSDPTTDPATTDPAGAPHPDDIPAEVPQDDPAAAPPPQEEEPAPEPSPAEGQPEGEEDPDATHAPSGSPTLPPVLEEDPALGVVAGELPGLADE